MPADSVFILNGLAGGGISLGPGAGEHVARLVGFALGMGDGPLQGAVLGSFVPLGLAGLAGLILLGLSCWLDRIRVGGIYGVAGCGSRRQHRWTRRKMDAVVGADEKQMARGARCCAGCYWFMLTIVVLTIVVAGTTWAGTSATRQTWPST